MTVIGPTRSWQAQSMDIFLNEPAALLSPSTIRSATFRPLILSRLVYILVCIKVALQGQFMKTEIGSYEAKTKLPELLRQVKTGKSFTITNRGEAIADLVPSLGARAKDKVAAAEKLKAFMLADPVRGVNIKALIEEGRA
jgi:prevent-host-death family protein